MNPQPQTRLVIFGKGGVGKSTFAGNLSIHYALSGRNVMHIGCDPKADSTLRLVKNPDCRDTVIQLLSKYGEVEMARDVVNEGRHGIRCIEAGGPEAGTGCGGRGIARVLEYIEKWDILNRHDAEIILFDVLGDVVCGGFAAPLRKGFAEKVVIVLTDDEMSYFAANNIAKAVVRYRGNGVALAGLVVNHTAQGSPPRRARDFAERIGTRIIGALPRSAAVDAARRHGLTVVEFDPDNPYARAVADIAAALLDMDRGLLPAPHPMELRTFLAWAQGTETRPGKPDAPAPAPPETPHDAETTKRKPRTGNRRLVEDRFSSLIGLTDQPFSFWGADLANVTPAGDGFLFEITSDRFETLTLAVQPAAGAREGIRTKHFDLTLQNGTLTNAVVKLMRHIAFRLGDFTLDALEDFYREWTRDPGDNRAEAARFPGAARTCGEKWGRFFADEEFRRNAIAMLSFDIPLVQVLHRDFECGFATDCIRNDEFTACNYPWLDPHLARDVLYSGMQETRSGCQTNIDEMDVVYGARDKLGLLLDDVIKNLDREKLVILNSACLPAVSGEDVSSVVKLAREKCPVPLMYIGPENADSLNPILEFFLSLKKDSGFKKVAPVPGTVNLIGFPLRRDTRDLESLLARMRIGINVNTLPAMDTSLFDTYGAAQVSVVLPNAFFDAISTLIFEDAPVPIIRPPAPYGMEGTHRWAAAVAQALGRTDEDLKALEDAREALRPDWEALRRRAAACSLGFVVDATGLERLHDPARNHGAPVLEMLREMGFRLELFVYFGNRGKLADAFPHVVPFGTREELRKALAASSCQALYTDFYFDTRPATAGKAQFSLQCFEMGFDGALRTMHRLVSACELPFFKRYGQYVR